MCHPAVAKYLGKSIPFIIIPFFFLSLIYLDCPCQGSQSVLMILEIQWQNEKEEVLHLRVKEGATLILAYRHSLFFTPQKELYTIYAGSLILREINFGNLEAAGYYDPNPPGGLHPEGSHWKIKPSHPVHFPELRMRIPYTVNFSLIINGSIVWTPKDKDRGALLILRTTPDR